MTVDEIKKLLTRKKFLGSSITLRQKRIDRDKQEYEKLSITVKLMKEYGLDVDEDDDPTIVSDMVLIILKEHKDGLHSAKILTEIQSRWKPEIVRTSLSPILTRLKTRSEVEFNDGIWRIK